MWAWVLGAAIAAPVGQGTAAFEANVGQAPAEVSHLVRGDHEVAFVTRDGFVLSVPGVEQVATLRARWRGAQPTAALAVEPLPGALHYFLDGPQGRRAERSRGVVATGVYPGIDLAYGLQDTLRFGFVIAPRADVGAIQLGFDRGAELRIEPRTAEIDLLDGSRRVLTVRLSGLRAWQEGPHRAVDVRFVPRGDALGVELGAHDPARAVHIDPDVTYASYIGSVAIDEGRDVAVDSAGMVYVAGHTQSPGALFPATSGSVQSTPPGMFEAFVLKVDPTQVGANSLVYGSFLGGQFSDFAESVDVDAAGRALVGGSTSFQPTNTFPSTPNAYSTAPQSAFVTVLNPAGSQLVYSTFFGGTGTSVTSVGFTPSGNLVAAGRADSAIPVLNELPITARSSGYVLEFDLARNQTASLVYGTRIGASNVLDLAVDATGVYLFGSTRAGLPTTPGAAQPTYSAGQDYFVMKLDTNRAGSAAVRYATYVGGLDNEGNGVFADGIAVDGAGAAYVTGSTGARLPTTAGSYSPAPPGGGEGFVAKLSPTGQSFEYSTYLGATGNDVAYAVAVDALGRAWVAGYGNGLPVDTCRPSSAGGGFVAQYDALGRRLEQAAYLSAAGNLRPYGIAVGPNGRAHVVGTVGAPSQLTSTPGAFQTVQAGADAFVAELAAAGPCADLEVSIVATPNPVAGPAPARLQVSLRNIGPSEVSRATLSAFIPPELTVRTPPPACSGGPSYVCPVGRLATGAVMTVTFDVEATAAGTFTATAAVAAQVQDPDPSNDADQLNVFVTAPSNPCGFETLYGSCSADTLRFCEDRGRPAERLTQVDCRTDAFPAGVPGECGLIDATYGFDCAVSVGGACAFVDAQDRPIFALCAGDGAGCRIDPAARTAQCEVGLPSCVSDGFSAQCAQDLLVQECQINQPVAVDCAAIGGQCRNARCEGLPVDSPCEAGRLECARGLDCDPVSERCEDPTTRCDPTTYASGCAGAVLTACDARDRVVSVDCSEAFSPPDGTACGAPFSCQGRSCSDVNVTCVGARPGARCDLAREIYCGPGLGCVLERAPDGAVIGTCRTTPTCGARPDPTCVGDVAPVCLRTDDVTVIEAQGVDCASFGSQCAVREGIPVCVGGEAATCQLLSRGGALLGCQDGLTCQDLDDDGFGTCRGRLVGPDGGVDAGMRVDAGTLEDGGAASDAGVRADGGPTTAPDAGTPPVREDEGGCRCASSASTTQGATWFAVVSCLVLRRRRG